MMDSGPSALDETASGTDAAGGVRLTASPATEEPSPARPTTSDFLIADIRRRIHSNTCFLAGRLEDAVRRSMGLAPMSASATALAGVLGFAVRLSIPVAITAAIGQWTDVPLWRWVLVAAVLGAADAASMWRHAPIDAPPRSGPRRLAEGMTALVPTIADESDLEELAEFTRRWYRLRVSSAVGLIVTLIILFACALLAPSAFRDLPVGSVGMLVFVLYDFGEMTSWNVFGWPFLVREARYDHRLFWKSPVDSAEVQATIAAWATMQLTLGISVTAHVALGVTLVAWNSPLLVPLALGLVVFGYVTTIGTMIGVRTSVRRIADRIRSRHLGTIQSLIDPYGARLSDLSPEDRAQLANLVALHDSVRNAPTSPRSSRTLLPAATALMIPTAMFVLTVFGEVYAERILDRILP